MPCADARLSSLSLEIRGSIVSSPFFNCITSPFLFTTEVHFPSASSFTVLTPGILYHASYTTEEQLARFTPTVSTSGVSGSVDFTFWGRGAATVRVSLRITRYHPRRLQHLLRGCSGLSRWTLGILRLFFTCDVTIAAGWSSTMLGMLATLSHLSFFFNYVGLDLTTATFLSSTRGINRNAAWFRCGVYPKDIDAVGDLSAVYIQYVITLINCYTHSSEASKQSDIDFSGLYLIRYRRRPL